MTILVDIVDDNVDRNFLHGLPTSLFGKPSRDAARDASVFASLFYLLFAITSTRISEKFSFC
jgi:hypothetical protein